MMNDDLILAYALNELSPPERRAADEQLQADPAAKAKLRAAQALLADLMDDAPVPPQGLAIDTLALVAAHLAETEPQTVTVPRSGFAAFVREFPIRKWIEAGIAASVGLLLAGLTVVGLQKHRKDADIAACQQTMHDLYRGLDGYAEDRGGAYPKVGTAAAPTAGGFINVLASAGQFPTGTVPTCPAGLTPGTELTTFAQHPERPLDDACVAQVSYHYTLGYRGPSNTVLPARRTMGDQTPLLADSCGVHSPHRTGQNVLFAGGHVRFTTTPSVGPGGDDIYRNDDNLVRAGLHTRDASLGHAGDVP
jgi:prepilin-type processing-associated H-X9-DG protein